MVKDEITDIGIQTGNKNNREEQILEAVKIYIGSRNDLIKEFARDIFRELDDQKRKRVLLFLSQTATSLKRKATINGLWSIAGLRAFSAIEDVMAALEGGGLIQELKDCLLLKASAGNNFRLTEALLSHGANVSARAKERYGYQPIHFSVWWNNFEMVKMLLKFGVEPQAINGYGETALDMAKERSQETFKFLTKNINNQKRG